MGEFPHKWPLITRSVLDRALQGVARPGRPSHHNAVLTDVERQDLADFMGTAADYGHPLKKSDRNIAVCEVLEWRQQNQSAGGRAFVKLTEAARTTLKNRKASKKFWRAFFRHSHG
jgi:hypothetical protein